MVLALATLLPATVHATDDCDSLPFPWFQDFQSYPSNMDRIMLADSCWYTWWSSSNTTWYGPRTVLVGDNTYIVANMSFFMHGFFASPAVEEMTDSVYFRFKVKYTGPCLVLYGVMNAEDTATFVAYDTVPSEANVDWVTVQFNAMDMPVSGNLRLAFRMEGYSTSQVMIDEVFVDRAASCLPLLDAVMTYADSTSVTLEWEQNGGSDISYVITLDDTMEFYTPSTMIDLNDLQPDHEYSYSIQGVCSDGTRTSPLYGTFSTLCQGVELPYFMDFDSVELGEIPYCWRIMDGMSFLYGVVYPSVYITSDGGNVFWLRDEAMVATPLILAQADSLHVTFDVSAHMQGRLEAGVVTRLADTSSFVVLKTVEGDEQAEFRTYEFFTEDLDYNGYVAVAFRWTENTSYSACESMLDNLRVELTSSCHNPTETMVDGIDANSAVLHWVDHSREPGTYEVRWGTVDDVDSCDENNIIFTADTFYYLQGLVFDNAYYVWVRSLCQGDTMQWVPFERFRTTCGTATLPYEEDFEAFVNGENMMCWRFEHSNPSVEDIPYVVEEFVYGHGGNALELNKLNALADTLTAMLPAFGTRGDELEVSFWVNGFTPTGSLAFLQAGLTNMATHEFVPALTVTGPFNGPAHYVFATDTMGVSDSVRVTFRWTAAASTVRVGLDDILVRFIPLCRAPDSLTVTDVADSSAMVHIHDQWHSGYYRVRYEDEFGNGGTVYTYSCDEMIYGLQHSTWYKLKVNGICFDGTSTDVVEKWFATQCYTITHDSLPYVEDFENYFPEGSGHISPCWNTINDNLSDHVYPKIFTDSSLGHSGTVDMITPVNYPYSQYVVLPEVDWLSDLYLEFKTYVSSIVISYEVGVMTDPGDATTFTTVNTLSPLYANMWETQTVQLASYNGLGRHIAIRVTAPLGSPASGLLARIDDVRLDKIPECSDTIKSLYAHTVGATCATVEWRTSIGYNYDAYYMIHVLNLNGTPVQTAESTGEVYTLCNLMPETPYKVYVELVCDSGVVATSDTVGFVTQCEDVNVVGVGTMSDNLLSSFYPMSCRYEHSSSQQLFFADDMQNIAGMLTDMSVRYTSTIGFSFVDKAVCTIYVAHTTDTSLTGLRSTEGMTRVYTGPLNLRPGWVTLPFEVPFHYDGTSNLVVAWETTVAGPIEANWCFFNVTYASDSTVVFRAPNGGLSYTGNRYVSRFSMCPDEVLYCEPPTIDDIQVTDHSITVSYVSDAPCEVHIARGWWNRGFTGVMEPSHSHTFDGLVHSTVYTVGVRKHCAADDISIWTLRRVSTMNINAVPLAGVDVEEVTFNGASVSWSRAADEHFWQLHFFNTVVDTIIELHEMNYSFTGLPSAYTYYVSVRAVYGSGDDVYSPWSDTASFTTDYCRPVSDIVVSNVTMTTAHISWIRSDNGNAWNVQYGFTGFNHGEEVADIYVEGESELDIADLVPGSGYNLYIATVCDSSHRSLWEGSDPFYTPDEHGSIDFAEEGAFVLYPNPASSAVTLRWLEERLPARLEIVDVNGRVVMRESVQSGTVTLPLDNIAAGVYFVRLTGDGYSMLRKLIVE